MLGHGFPSWLPVGEGQSQDWMTRDISGNPHLWRTDNSRQSQTRRQDGREPGHPVGHGRLSGEEVGHDQGSPVKLSSCQRSEREEELQPTA